MAASRAAAPPTTGAPMNRLPSLEALERLYAERAGAAYGEGVSQMEHALQCAVLAEADGAPPGLIVAAQRWLCLKEPGYFETLSPASRRTLELQGGVFDAAQADAFERRPHWREAVALRRYDDLGKRPERCGRTFVDFLPLMRTLTAG